MQKLIVGNWKMNCNQKEGIELIKKIIEGLKAKDLSSVKIVLCPPFTLLKSARLLIDKHLPALGLGAQNCHFDLQGSYTGEISPKMLVDFCEYVILGHSERRRYFYEDNELINKKIKAAWQSGLTPIVCVGEKKKGEGFSGLLRELKGVIEGVDKVKLDRMILVYEPYWAVGTDDAADPDYAYDVVKRMKDLLPKKTLVLYGGSVSSSNISLFARHSIIDGVLVGRASLEANEFLKIITKVRDYVSQP